HPSNSYIYLYGDVDVNERLEYLNDEYLKDFDILKKDTTIKLQKPFEQKKEIIRPYAITSDEPLENNTYLSLNWSVGTSLDRELYLAMDILDYVLISSTGGLLKDALIKSGLGSDVDSSYENSIYQPMYSIVLHNSDASKKEEFERVVRKTLKKIVDDGIDRDMILAGINNFEFKYREADFGSYPKGLMYGLQIFDSWLYDENEPFMHIAAGQTFNEIRKKYKDGYFENLIEKYLLNNTHCSLVVLEPEVGLTKLTEEHTEKILSDYKATLSNGKLEELVAQTMALEAYQEEPSSQEALETIPMLTLDDMDKKTQPLYIDRRDICCVPFVYSNIFSNRINYISFAFNCKMVPEKLVPYVGLLSSVLGEMDTTHYTYSQLSNAININLGGIAAVASSYINSKNLEQVDLFFEVKTKVLYGKTDFAIEIIREILMETKFDDYARLKELISRIKSRLEAKLISAGHSIALTEASSQFSKSADYANRIRGYGFYQLIEELDKNFDMNSVHMVLLDG
ncbi:MAG: insulinase family protein, partial [Lachnospiraceae bacterium]